MSNTHSNQKIRIAWGLGAAITSIFFILLLVARSPMESKYEGRDLGQWVRSAEKRSSRDPAILAIEMIGPESVLPVFRHYLRVPPM